MKANEINEKIKRLFPKLKVTESKNTINESFPMKVFSDDTTEILLSVKDDVLGIEYETLDGESSGFLQLTDFGHFEADIRKKLEGVAKKHVTNLTKFFSLFYKDSDPVIMGEEGPKAKEIIKELIDTDWSKDNESQMKAVQLLKGLALSEEPEANDFMKKIDDFTSSMKITESNMKDEAQKFASLVGKRDYVQRTEIGDIGSDEVPTVEVETKDDVFTFDFTDKGIFVMDFSKTKNIGKKAEDAVEWLNSLYEALKNEAAKQIAPESVRTQYKEISKKLDALDAEKKKAHDAWAKEDDDKKRLDLYDKKQKIMDQIEKVNADRKKILNKYRGVITKQS